jgi:hypothetical protein
MSSVQKVPWTAAYLEMQKCATQASCTAGLVDLRVFLLTILCCFPNTQPDEPCGNEIDDWLNIGCMALSFPLPRTFPSKYSQAIQVARLPAERADFARMSSPVAHTAPPR